MSTTDINTISLSGRLVRDPQLRHVGDGRAVCDLRIAVNGSGDDVTYVDVTSFGKPAEACAQYLTKGRQVSVTGRLAYREWTANDGVRRSKHSVIGRVHFGPHHKATAS